MEDDILKGIYELLKAHYEKEEQPEEQAEPVEEEDDE